MAIVTRGSGGSIKFSGTGGGISITSSGGGGGGGGSIVTSDLIVHLDAGNTASYQYSGNYYSNWTDLSGQGNDALVFGGPTVDGNNGGSMVFNGGIWATFNTVTGFPFGTSPGTLSCWAKASTVTGGSMWLVGYGTNSPSSSRMLGVQNDTYYFDGYDDAITASGVTINTWFNMTGVYDGTNASMYINGALVAGPTAKSWNTINSAREVGRKTNGGELWNGNIAKVLMYSKALNSGEVLQNFNADKTRFGL